jgi:hypothetical protein
VSAKFRQFCSHVSTAIGIKGNFDWLPRLDSNQE